MSGIAETLQACFEDLESGAASVDEVVERYVAADGTHEELSALLAVAERYRRAPDVQPSIEFRQSARARMLALTAERPAKHRSSVWPPRLTWVGIGPISLVRVAAAVVAVALVAIGGGTAVLASPPSSPLFGARLAIEEAQVLTTPSAGERLGLRMAMADRRAAELEAMAESARVGEIAPAAILYQSALRGEIEESSLAADLEVILLDQRLASQEEMLRRAALAAGAVDAPGAWSVDEALEALTRERARLRERLGKGSPGPSPTSTDGLLNQDTSDTAPLPEPGASPSPPATATTSAADDPGRQEQTREGGERDAVGTPTPSASTPTPHSSTSDSGQERNREQGPTVAPTSPARKATATPVPAKPGGRRGTSVATPSPQTGSSSGGPGSGPGGPTGTQSGSSGTRSGR